MKSQIKNDLLKFNKSTMVELNDDQTKATDGGSIILTITIPIIITITVA